MRLSSVLLILSILFFNACGEAERPQKVLFVLPSTDFTKTTFSFSLLNRIEYVVATRRNMQQLRIEDLSYLEEDSLKSVDILAFVGVMGKNLSLYQQNTVERYVQKGGTLVSFNDSIPPPYEWAWYEQFFMEITLKYRVKNTNTGFQYFEKEGEKVILAHFEEENATEEEIYNFIEEWNKVLDFGLEYDKSKRHPSKAETPKMPDFQRFNKVVLDDNVYEPMELEVLPDGRVVFIERRGLMKVYDPRLKETKVIGSFDVCTEGNYEDGLLGLALDPKYGKENFYLYLYYSPPCDVPYQYLSRFLMLGDTILPNSEKVVMKVFVQRETCCHSGGSLEFGADGFLYLSTGDNTSSKESDGYSPLDERPGRSPFDAQKSSSNTHDLRGKILRIKVEKNGGYSIPDGNLFPKDGSKGRPEIYVMGARNPFRIAIDAKTNFLYWGDVGPDSGTDSPKYGPQSYDEWNQARKAGNYGWPYFVGDNKAYPMRDFAMDMVGKPQDPNHPMNLSPFNTGSKILPPAELPMIWYPYGKSEEFPILGEGSRSAMCGPIYYDDYYVKDYDSKVKFPDYYNGKMFIYEWARSWILAVSFDDKGDLLQIEPFLPDMELEKPIDMVFGPDGAMYILEYGRQYFLNNPDATLSRIEFSQGNRPPIANILADKPNGAAPHTVGFSAAESLDYDLEDSLLTYEWFFAKDGDDSQLPPNLENTSEIQGKIVEHTFNENGNYTAILKATDSHGATSIAKTPIQVGNAPPTISLNFNGNRSFFFPNSKAGYEMKIADLEDEKRGGIEVENAFVSWAFLENEGYVSDIESGKLQLPKASIRHLEGSFLMKKSDCYTCHNLESLNIGPTYRQVAQKYPFTDESVTYLASKIINGGNGVWGERLMAAHPQLSENEAAAIARYILSLVEKSEKLKGEINLDLKGKNADKGAFVVTANYTDKGTEGFEAITTRETLILKPPKLEVENADFFHECQTCAFGKDMEFVMLCGVQDSAYVRFENIDLKDIKKVSLRVRVKDDCRVNLKVDSIDGEVIGSLQFAPKSAEEDWRIVTVPIEGNGNKIEGKRDFYLEFEDVGEDKKGWGLVELDWVRFDLP